MNKQTLFRQIKNKSSFLCVGLDPDLNKLPRHLSKEADPLFEFNKQIIDATADFAVAYKPNLAFYEVLGPKGWESLQKTLDYIPQEIFTIADAKRGDIGNTASLYAKTFFETMDFDAVTLAPYMGKDSIMPFLEYRGKWAILLALTSNKGSADFQLLELHPDKTLYQEVIEKSKSWGSDENTMYVIGATAGEKIQTARQLVPEHFFLVPGVGAQGGDLEEVAKYGMNSSCGLLVNSSRGIIYASSNADFGKAAQVEAQKMQQEMQQYLEKYCG